MIWSHYMFRSCLAPIYFTAVLPYNCDFIGQRNRGGSTARSHRHHARCLRLLFSSDRSSVLSPRCSTARRSHWFLPPAHPHRMHWGCRSFPRYYRVREFPAISNQILTRPPSGLRLALGSRTRIHRYPTACSNGCSSTSTALLCGYLLLFSRFP